MNVSPCIRRRGNPFRRQVTKAQRLIKVDGIGEDAVARKDQRTRSQHPGLLKDVLEDLATDAPAPVLLGNGHLSQFIDARLLNQESAAPYRTAIDDRDKDMAAGPQNIILRIVQYFAVLVLKPKPL